MVDERYILYRPALMPSVVDCKEGRMMILLFSGSSLGGEMILVLAGNGCLLLVHMGFFGKEAVGGVTYGRGY